MYNKVTSTQEGIKADIFLEKDLFALKNHGVCLLDAVKQYKQMQKGVPSVKPISAVTEASGYLKVFSQAEIDEMLDKYSIFEEVRPSVYFVPAAGAASRMFRLFNVVVANNAVNLQESLEKLDKKDQEAVQKIFTAIKSESMAFCYNLKLTAAAKGFDLTKAIKEEDVVSIFNFILKDMNYANLPKAVIPAHLYPELGDFRTPLEEHIRFLLELQGPDMRIHLAISPEHQELINNEMEIIKNKLRQEGLDININFSTSIQHPSTDAIAYDVDKDRPLRDEKGDIVIRKAGHGSLIKNLDELSKHFDGIFLRNIDNVKPENFNQEISDYKKVMRVKAGQLQAQSFAYINYLQSLHSNYAKDESFVLSSYAFGLINEIIDFINDDLMFNVDISLSFNQFRDNSLQCLVGNNNGFLEISFKELLEILVNILDRPISVVAYVPLEPGQKGGGGFVSQIEVDILGHKITVEKATTVEGQELEGGQKNPIFSEQATHFNPVDIYVTTKRYNGEAFKLSDFSDASRAMVDKKDLFPGVKSRIWENPGLWNGGMAKMFQVSIHAPKETFAPIKEFHDVLKPEHTPGATEPTGK